MNFKIQNTFFIFNSPSYLFISIQYLCNLLDNILIVETDVALHEETFLNVAMK